MSVTSGMNIEEVEAIGRRLQNGHSDATRTVVQRMDALVSSSRSMWVGADAERFRAWWPAKRSEILAVADDLHGYGQSALNNAEEQRTASGDGTSGVPSLGVGAALPWSNGESSPGQVEEWWNGLSSEERAEWVEARPEALGNLEGLPMSVRYDANRLLAEQEHDRLLTTAGSSASDIAAMEYLMREDVSVLFLDIERGEAAVVHGDLENSVEAIITTPGTGNNIGKLPKFSEESAGLVDENRGRAVVATLLWDPPINLYDNALINLHKDSILDGGMDNVVRSVSSEVGTVISVSHSAGTDAMQEWAALSDEAYLVDGYVLMAAPNPERVPDSIGTDTPVGFAYHDKDPVLDTDLTQPDNFGDASGFGYRDNAGDAEAVVLERLESGYLEVKPSGHGDTLVLTRHHENSKYFENFGGLINRVSDDIANSGVTF